MRILVDGLAFGMQRFGGVSRIWERYLTRFPEHGVRVKLLVPFGHHNASLHRVLAHAEACDAVVDYLHWPIRVFHRPSLRSLLLRAHLDRTIEVFHSTYYSTVHYAGVPSVVTAYDMILERFEGLFPARWRRFGMAIKRATLQSADRIVAISESTKQDLLDIYPDIGSERIAVVYPGTAPPHEPTTLSIEDISGAHGFRVEPQGYLLYVGLRRGYKNFRIVADLLQSSSHWKDIQVLCVGGEENGEDTLGPDAAALPNLILLPYVSDGELAVLYRNAAALVYPSLYEGFGLPVLEAMTNSCPVVCSNSSSLPEVGGNAAFYFDPYSVESLEDALLRVLATDRATVVARGLGNAARFSWEASTRALVDIYSSLA